MWPSERPLPDDVDEGFGEYYTRAGEVSEFEVGGRVLGDLFEEAGGEAEEGVFDFGPDDREGVVHVG